MIGVLVLISVMHSTTMECDSNGWDSTAIILGQEVRIINYDSGGVPLSFASQEYIGINKEFLDLPKFVQEFLIAHELGHVYLGHLDQEPEMARDLYPSIWNTVSPFESDADLFAAEIVGFDTATKALLFCESHCFKIGALGCFVESGIRSKLLQEKVCL